jgi:hypothetical protein
LDLEKILINSSWKMRWRVLELIVRKRRKKLGRGGKGA